MKAVLHVERVGFDADLRLPAGRVEVVSIEFDRVVEATCVSRAGREWSIDGDSARGVVVSSDEADDVPLGSLPDGWRPVVLAAVDAYLRRVPVPAPDDREEDGDDD